MKTLTVNDVNWSIFAQTDDLPVRGNAIASGSATFDREVEDKILGRMEEGDVWAWAMVMVQGEFNGLTASAYLGGCNYPNEDSFKTGGYYGDMQAEILDYLNAKVKTLCEAVSD